MQVPYPRCADTLSELDAIVGAHPMGRPPLTTILGVSDLTAQALLAEIDLDMTRFSDAGHLVSWDGLCPRNDESAGKRRSTRVRKSGTWLKVALMTAAWAAVRVKPAICAPRSCASRTAARQEGHSRSGRLHAHRRSPHALR